MPKLGLTTRRAVALATSAVILGAVVAPAALAQKTGDFRIALIASKSGPLEAYAKQTSWVSRWAWTTPPRAP